MLFWIVLFSLLGGLGAIAGAALFMLFPERLRLPLIPYLLSYATGTLLGAAFLGMIPAGLKQAAPRVVTGSVLLGIVLFFVLEKLILWRHCHQTDCEVHGRHGALIILGDSFHNFVDGVMLAAAFITSFPLGVSAALAVIAHEIPQELGDFAILLKSGYSRSKALFWNGLSSLASLPGAIIGYFWLDSARQAMPFILALSAASFIYIAMADLMPDLHEDTRPQTSALQLLLMLAGMGTIALFKLRG